MKTLKNGLQTILAISVLSVSGLRAQTVPRFVKYDIMETGAKIYLPGKPEFEMNLSDDKSEVITTEVAFDGISYGVIAVKLNEALDENGEDWETTLFSYMEFLDSNAFALTSSIPPGYGHTLDSHPKAKGILQYGEDAEGNQYAIKGWVDNEMLAVLYVYFKGEMNVNFQNIFLNGFRFPEQ